MRRHWSEKNAMSGFLALMNAAPDDIAKVSGAVNNCRDAAKNMADTMQDNLEGQLTILEVTASGAGDFFRGSADACGTGIVSDCRDGGRAECHAGRGEER